MKHSELKRNLNEALKTYSMQDLFAAVTNVLAHDNTMTSEEKFGVKSVLDEFIGLFAISVVGRPIEEYRRTLEKYLNDVNVPIEWREPAKRVFEEAFEVMFNAPPYDPKSEAERATEE